MKPRLVLALHFHQPVGNFDSVFRDAVRLCYAPLVAHFERHPRVRAAFHLSGCLIEWLEGNARPILDRVVGLVGRGQIEPLGGAFYEPILSVIPRPDALDQIERLAAWWLKRCGLRPRGAWIAERVWEPALAEVLAAAKVEYTVLDDQHLRFAGLVDDRFSGPFVTERHGQGVAFFPSDFQLRYLIPFRPIEAVRRHFVDLCADGREWILTYGDDAEKFGLWPGTHRWVHEEGWLEQFFALLQEEGGPVSVEAPGACLDGGPPARRVYVPNASYTEMLEWALPAVSIPAYVRTRTAALRDAPDEDVRAFVRGSLWDMFLARYPEADQMHKHSLWSSRRARALPEGAPGREEAITAVLRAECNCAYWHGVFGGVYFPHLRHGVYQSLLAADAILAAAEERPVSVEVGDWDGDREREVNLRSATVQAFFRPADAGTLVELDYLPARFNVTNVMSRWRERYHDGADLTHAPASGGALASPHEQAVGADAADLEGRHFDALPLRSLRDFRTSSPPAGASLAMFRGMELLSGRVVSWSERADGFSARLTLGALGYQRSVAIDRTGSLRIAWEMDAAPENAAGWFGTLLCLSLLVRQDPERDSVVRQENAGEIRCAPGDPVDLAGVIRLTLVDRAFGFALDIAPRPAGRLTTSPIETLQRSEDRLESTYQGTLFAIAWPLETSQRRTAAFELGLSFRSLG